MRLLLLLPCLLLVVALDPEQGYTPLLANRRMQTLSWEVEYNELNDRRDEEAQEIIMKRIDYGNDSSSSSTSDDVPGWKKAWAKIFIKAKLEAINITNPDPRTRNIIQMAAGRPEGVPCGDPQQPVLPGACVPPEACEHTEFRIYRGDYYCGRTQYVCCAILVTNREDFQNILAPSFSDSEFETSSSEILRREQSKEKKSKKKDKDDKKKRNKKVRKKMRKLVKKIRKQLKKVYKNSTKERKKRNKQYDHFRTLFKKIVKKQKQRLKKDKKVSLDEVDDQVLRIFNIIYTYERNFMKNETVRDYILQQTNMTPESLRQLTHSYPELLDVMDMRRSGRKLPPKGVGYDVQFGVLQF